MITKTNERRASAHLRSMTVMTSAVLLCIGFQGPATAAGNDLTVRTPADQSLFPRAFGVLANERLMFPVDMSNWPVKIDRSRQLFVDDYLIASTSGITRTVHQMIKHPDNPIVVGEHPWEGAGPVHQIVRFDDDSGRFRMWYAGRSRYELPTGVSVRFPTLYAESKDGITWEKPDLGLCEFDGSTANNIIIPAGDIRGLIDEPHDPDPSRRYKGIVWHEPEYVPREGYFLYTSPDGIRWTREREAPLAVSLNGYTMPQTGIGDTSIFRWDRRLGKYVGDVKFVLPPKMRCRGMMESDDLIHWTRPRMTFYPDALDDPDSQIYGHLSFCYESVWLGFLRVMHTERTKGYKQTTVELTASRDGRHWTRVGYREPVLPLGAEDEWDTDYHDPCWDPLPVGDELWVYYRSGRLRRDETRRYALGLAKIRRDGFVSLDAGTQPATIRTRPLTCRGKTLYVNALVNEGGSIRAAVMNSGGSQLPGYTFEESQAYTGDSTHARMAWRGAAPKTFKFLLTSMCALSSGCKTRSCTRFRLSRRRGPAISGASVQSANVLIADSTISKGVDARLIDFNRRRPQTAPIGGAAGGWPSSWPRR